MGLPGTLGAPDQRYGGFGGADSSMLGDTDEFFASVERGLNVKQDVSPRGVSSYANGLNLALGALGDFLSGTGSDSRTYTDGSTQVQDLINSKDGVQMLKQMAAKGFKVGSHGGIDSMDAFKNTAGDWFLNGTEFQLGAFTWKTTARIGSSVNVFVQNEMTANSFLYHAGEDLNYYRGPIDTPYGNISIQQPMSTIAQYLIFHVTAPK